MILADLEDRSATLRETETQLKLQQNDSDIYRQKIKALEKSNGELHEKVAQLESKLTAVKDQQLKTQKEKDQQEISLNNQIEMLQYKLLSGERAGSMAAATDSSETFS